ncbi:MAG TPA: hypothetical protein VFE98_07035 [Candidatus Bathyarchaeia archaeon]|nr:hypothetical protein [Candidatus Bathyarchaeia archaeon]
MEDDLGKEDRIREGIVRQLRRNLARCQKVLRDESLDLSVREKWTQLHTHTSQVLNQVLKDCQIRLYEKRMKVLEEYTRVHGRLPG